METLVLRERLGQRPSAPQRCPQHCCPAAGPQRALGYRLVIETAPSQLAASVLWHGLPEMDQADQAVPVGRRVWSEVLGLSTLWAPARQTQLLAFGSRGQCTTISGSPAAGSVPQPCRSSTFAPQGLWLPQVRVGVALCLWAGGWGGCRCRSGRLSQSHLRQAEWSLSSTAGSGLPLGLSSCLARQPPSSLLRGQRRRPAPGCGSSMQSRAQGTAGGHHAGCAPRVATSQAQHQPLPRAARVRAAQGARWDTRAACIRRQTWCTHCVSSTPYPPAHVLDTHSSACRPCLACPTCRQRGCQHTPQWTGQPGLATCAAPAQAGPAPAQGRCRAACQSTPRRSRPPRPRLRLRARLAGAPGLQGPEIKVQAVAQPVSAHLHCECGR